MSDLNTLKQNLLTSSDARAELLTDLENLVAKHGVDVTNPEVRDQLGLDANVNDGEEFMAAVNKHAIIFLTG